MNNRYRFTITILLAALLGGVNATAVTVKGSVFGGGNQADVQTNTAVNISAGQVVGNVYGGGNLGDVGTIDKSDPSYNYTWSDTDGNANGTDDTKNTGVSNVNITGGTIGANVFGGGKGNDESFYCEKGMVYSTNVSITKGTVNGNVYGGGQIARVESNTIVTIDSETEDDATHIIGNVFGAGAGLETHGYSALVRGNPVVTIQGHAKVEQDVYGGGEIASVGRHKVKTGANTPADAPADLPVGMPYTLMNTNSGICTVDIKGSAEINGNVFGAGKGLVPAYNENNKPTRIIIGNGTETFNTEDAYFVFLQTLALSTETDVTISGGATVKGSVFGGSKSGFVQYHTNVTIAGGTIGTNGETDPDKGNIYGGGLGVEGSDFAGRVSGNTKISIDGGITHGAVYGGGAYGIVKQSVEVSVNGGEVKKDVYGGGALANTNTENWDNSSLTIYHEVSGLTVGTSIVTGLYTESSGTYTEVTTANATAEQDVTYYRLTDTKVNLTGGTVNGDVYGGGLGNSNIAALVYGEVHVNIGDISQLGHNDQGPNISGDVFGCNNINGSPQDNVFVDVYHTKHNDTNKYPRDENDNITVDLVDLNVDDPEASEYTQLFALNAVYGGGNKAAYTAVDKTATVTIHDCYDNTVRTVYGGGNAADATNVQVIIEGGRFDRVFGGGNGYSSTNNHDDPDGENYNPGADVSGTATTEIYGGIFRQIFGGSNQYGDVGSASLTIDQNCDLLLNESFGGANEAVITGDIVTTLYCGSNISVGNFYGGSNKANITGNVTLNVEGGTYENVFGGSKGTSTTPANITGDVTLNLYGGTMINAFGGSDVNGNITGKITVNVLDYQSSTCPLNVTNIYGAGNLTAYTPNQVNSQVISSPEVNVMHIKSGSSITGNVYGGGKGDTSHDAIVTANPVVNIGYDATTMSGLIPTGYIGEPGVLSSTDNLLATISGNVYGGGDLAQVAGSTTINLRKANSSVGNIFGGGNLANVSGSTTVNINNGTVNQDVYGGGALANVGTNSNDATSVTIAGGTVTGNIYGGGLGRIAVEDDPTTTEVDETVSAVAALVNGAVTVSVNGGTVADVFGCNNYNGAPQSTVTVNINSNVSGNVYGGGNLAAYTGSPSVNINNGTITQSVYGGGKGNTAIVTGNPVVTIGDNTSNSTYAIVTGNVYGGGDAAAVTGNTSVTYNDSHASSTVAKLFGGGNAASVSGTTTVTLTNGKVTAGVYGGCNASGSVGAVTVALNGGAVGASGSGNEADVFGGGYGHNTSTTGNVDVTLYGTTVYGDIYGGSALGSVNASTSNTTTITISSNTLYGTIYGGGEGSGSSNDTKATSNGNVQINYNTANTNLAGLYGGANVNGTVAGGIEVNVKANVGAAATGTSGDPGYVPENRIDIFGGGYGANTNTEGNVTVTIGDLEGTKVPVIYGDIYGGSALGNVNNEATDLTKVDFLNGELHGNIYGGGLGDRASLGDGHADVSAKVYGQVQVNISNSTQTAEQCKIDLRNAKIYGCNNTNGSPQDNVTVNIYKTAYNYSDYLTGDKYKASYTTAVNSVDPDYAIDQVFGGGNQADYAPENGLASSAKKATVRIYGCNNTIRRVFAGGNAAAATGVVNEIDGGRFDYVFGGGNGESSHADIGLGGTDLRVHGGKITNLFGGSNESGTITGNMGVSVDATGDCASDMFIDEFFCGNNLADIGTAQNPVNINASIGCGTRFGDVYGGCNEAHIYGNVTLTILGGEISTVYGGSKGTAQTAADIEGNVTLTINGGHIENAFGGSNINGNIKGSIQVNVDKDAESECGISNWYIGNVYGASNLAPYTPTTQGNTLTVNIKNGLVSGSVYGGGKGGTAIVTSNPVVTIGDNSSDSYCAIVTGNVYGGGDEAAVSGNTTVNYNDTNASSTVANLFGGGNAANVSGNTTVNMIAGKVTTSIYGGCNSTGTVGGNATVQVTGGTVGTAPVANAAPTDVIFGGGKGEPTLVEGNVIVNIGTSGQATAGATVNGHIYGGSALGNTNASGPSTFNADKTTQVNLYKGIINGDVFGGGLGQKTGVQGAASDILSYVGGDVTVTLDGATLVNIYNEGTHETGRIFGCNNLNGEPKGKVAVNITSGTAVNVYGGGNQAAYTYANASNPLTVQMTGGNVSNNIFGGGLSADVTGSVTVIINGGTVTNDVYGGGALANTNIGNVTNYGKNNESISSTATYTTTVNLTGGTIGNAYGGGLGRQAATGIEAIDAIVYGDVTVTVNGTAFSKLIEDGFVKKGRVFGCNNLQGTPKGNVKVTVWRTTVYDQNGDIINTKPTITSDNYTNPNSFELIAVYGGGNQANYKPVSGKNTQVNIRGCGLTNIMQVYGSGNSADVPTSDVIIWGSDVIGTVFGGGNGSEPGSPGANVEGLAKITLKSGEIYDVFGASNTKGTCGSTEINDQNTSGGDCNELKIRNMYGAGKSADVIGNVTVDISGCNTSDGVNVYAGSYNAKITGSVTLNITGGVLNDVFAGNNAGGSIGGPIVVNVEETDDCKPIIINNLYGGGNLAAYPGEGAKTYKGTGDPNDASSYDDYTEGEIFLNVRSCTYIGNIFGGGYGSTAGVTGDTEVDINLTKGNWANATNKTYTFSYENIGVTKTSADDIKAEIEAKIPNITASVINTTTKTFTATIKNIIGTIGNVYGSGNKGKVTGNTVVNIGTEQKVYYVNEPIQFRTESSTPLTPIASGTNKDRYEATVEGAYISGNVYGGGKEADVTKNTYVNICANKSGNDYVAIAEGTSGVSIGGNVYGGGKGADDNFTCDKAMVGVLDQGVTVSGTSPNETYTLRPGGTNVRIGNGTIGNGTTGGNVYGGGEIARVENNTQVTIGLPAGQGGTSAPVVKGSVFAAGAGVVTHGYSALVRGTSTVTVQGNAQVWNNVYGGGELASVGRYWVASTPALATQNHVSVGMPYGLKAGGTSTVVIQGNATIGDDDIANSGNVFGAGMGIEPRDYDYAFGEDGVSGYSLDTHKPKRMMNHIVYDESTGKGHNPAEENKTWKYYVDEDGHPDTRYVWEYFANRTAYLQFIETLALSAETNVTIKESATVKGSVYGGSQKGFVYRNTDVKIQNGTIENDVYGGGLGLASYSKAGQVGGNTYVTISNGAIKGNVYGGGKLGPVGTFVVSDDMRNFYWTNNLLANINSENATTFPYNNTGVCNVTISGGTIGISGVTMNSEGSFANGNVFGSGKGLDDTFWCEKGIAYKTNVNINAGTVNGNVYGGGEVGRVETTADVKIGPDTGTSSPNIVGNVFGGGAGVKTHGYSGLIRGNTYVTVQSEATVGHNVYGGGQIAAVGKYYLVDATYKENHPESNLEIGMPYSLVSDALGISNVTIKGNATITGNVFGAGKGKEPETYTFADNANRPKRMMSYNTALFTESNHSIWEFADTNEKYVWEYFDTKPKYQTFLETLGLSTQAFVTIGGTRNETTGVVTASGEPTVNGSVFGGSESGFVQHHTSVTIAGGTIGTTDTGGDVFGGGLGTLLFAEAGRVRGNTTVNIQGGAVKGNVYGGGSLGDVGTITKPANDYNYTWKQDDGNTANSINNNTITGTNNNTGVCTVTVSGGEIGLASTDEPTKHGNVFGAGRGSSTTWWCEKAIVYATNVNVSKGTVKGNVYGGGEVGRVEDDAKVTIGTPGGTDEFNITGSIFGAGAGIATHGYSALVRGNSDVTVQGKAQVGGSVYGGGEIASVGRFKVVGGLPSKPQAGGNCTVTIKGNAKIGVSGTGHNVFGACKGVALTAYQLTNETYTGDNRPKSMQLIGNAPDNTDLWSHYNNDENSPFIWVYYPTKAAYLDFLKTLALTSNTDVTIDGSSEVYGSVYGGGERGITLGGVDVNMLSGTVHEDVYGGGSLADANVAMWDAAHQTLYDYVPLELIPGLSHVTGYYTKSGDDYTLTSKTIAGEGEANSYYALYKTNVNLLGGIIGGNAYGGGLGDLATLGTGHSNVEAKVYGDVKVNLNGLEKADYSNFHAKYPTFTLAHVDGDNSDYMIPNSGQKGAIVNKIFGCNNLNGTPMAHVKVHVFATQNANTNTIAQADKYGHPVQGEKGYENETMAEYLTRLAAFYPSSSPASNTAALLISAAQTANTAYNDASESEKEQKLTALNNAIATMNTELNKFYDVEAVYGGGNLAKYEPADPTPSAPYNDTEEYTEVIIDGCGYTSIKQVYGGGNAAPVSATLVRVNGTYEIDEVFGGGNGADNYTMNEGGTDIWHENPGANVGYYNYTHWAESTTVDTSVHPGGTVDNPLHLAVNNTDASTANLRRTNYGYGTGVATTDIRGGTIHYVFGGSNKKGNISTTALSVYSEADDGCLITILESYGGGKDAPIDGEINVTLDCVKEMDMIFGGAKNADINNNVTLNITNGTFKKVFGGNNTSGAINGSITVNIEENGCVPIQIDELYGGGYLAPYSKYGYKKDDSGRYIYYEVDADNNYKIDPSTNDYIIVEGPADNAKLMPLNADDEGALDVPHNDPRINIISASRIGTVYGGGYKAKVVGSPHVNVNMTEGKIPSQYVTNLSNHFVGNHTDDNDNILWVGKEIATSGDGILEIGTIDTVYGGGNLADIVGDTYVEIGTGKWISWDDQGNPIWETEDASGKKYKSSQTSNAVTYSQAECNAYNKNLKGYIASTKALTSAQATAVNTKLGTSYNENDVIFVEDAAAYNATLEGLRKTTDVKTPAVYYTQAECDEYNSAHNLSIGDAGYRKITDIKTPAVYYTQAECSAYNAENITDYIACTATLEAKKAVAVNEAIGANYAAGATIYTEDAAAFNATLNGYLTTADVKEPAKWTWYDVTDPSVPVDQPTPARNAANITGDVYGGGKGLADNFTCNKAMVGVDGDGVNNPDGGTNVTIANGTIGGSVYGGGKIARVEKNTVVTIGLGDGVDETTSTPTSAPVINGNVFGAGKGVETHGYSALVRGNPTVIIQGNAKVEGSVYGGGEIASVARYKVVNGSPVALANKTSGNCKVIIRGYAEVGPDNMKMYHVDGDNNIVENDKPDDTGHVFGAGKGILPKIYSYEDNAHKPRRMLAKGTPLTSGNSTSEEYDANNIWEYFGNDEDYHKFIETLALSSKTDVIITDHAFVKGSVYGGSMNGIVQYNTHVTIEGDCQIGAGEGVNRRYTPDEWAYDGSDDAHSLPECAHWDYGKDTDSDGKNDLFATYDPFAEANGVYDYTNYSSIPESKRRTSTEGGMRVATDGHTYYGNVFGGGSGVEPYAPGLWHRAAGIVRGNTVVDITGGHILTNVYGGNEHTDVGTYAADNLTPKSGGICTINMVGGTLGVPRTLEQITAHPVICYLFGAGKGDQRIFFNTWTNVIETEVNISGNARIYGSTFGGGEDGHVMNDAVTNIGGSVTIVGTTYTQPAETSAENPGVLIGTTGTSYVDGNVFGGGRGFSGDAQTAGTIGGNVTLNIAGGTMLGSVYGGGRIASVGTQFAAPNDPNYGNFVEDDNGKTYGHVTINISGGTIGNKNATGSDDDIKHSGNVFGGSMGRLTLLDGTTNNIWPKLAQVKTAAVNIYGNAKILRNVYGGGELGTVRDNAFVTIGGYLNPDVTIVKNPNPVTSDITKTNNDNPTIERDVFGGGYGSVNSNYTIIHVKELKATATAPYSAESYEDHSYAFSPMQFAGCVGKNTYVNIVGGWVKKNTYGGGEMASVGIIDCLVDEKDNSALTTSDVVVRSGNEKSFIYRNMRDHTRSIDSDNRFLDFGISWPFEFNYIPGFDGNTHVNVTGGRLGITGKDYMGSDNTLPDEQKEKLREDNGDVFGAGKGIAGDYHQYVFCANVGSTDVKIAYTSNSDPISYKTDESDCVTGSVYAGSENGHVIGDTHLTLSGGLIGHAIYGGGKGKGTYNEWLNVINGVSVIQDKTPEEQVSPDKRNNDTEYKATIYSITAGKVFGNTNVTMTGGYVIRNVYGGGNMGSVGKGNYSGGQDDYSTTGYGELPPSGKDLWSTSTYQENETNYAWHFLNSGKSTVTITGGTIGYIDHDKPSKSIKDGLPYGNVFGGCRGESAPNIGETPRYQYSPSSYSGYVNETEVTIGDDTSGPTILGSVYGGGQDGHVRRDTKVIINKGIIGIPFSSDYNDTDYKTLLGTDLENEQWLHRGNVYGAGSGIGKYQYDFNYDGDYEDDVRYTNPQTHQTSDLNETDYSTSAGSVTRFTYVEINDGTIYRNVYGGGSNASIGAPKIPVNGVMPDDPIRRDDNSTATQGKQSLNWIVINGGTIGSNNTAGYGGNVYGASRGIDELDSRFATSVWTNVEARNGHIFGNVFGGGESGSVAKDTYVEIGGKVPDTTTSSPAPMRSSQETNISSNVATQPEQQRTITPQQAQPSPTGNAATEATGARNITINRAAQ